MQKHAKLQKRDKAILIFRLIAVALWVLFVRAAGGFDHYDAQGQAMDRMFALLVFPFALAFSIAFLKQLSALPEPEQSGGAQSENLRDIESAPMEMLNKKRTAPDPARQRQKLPLVCQKKATALRRFLSAELKFSERQELCPTRPTFLALALPLPAAPASIPGSFGAPGRSGPRGAPAPNSRRA